MVKYIFTENILMFMFIEIETKYFQNGCWGGRGVKHHNFTILTFTLVEWTNADLVPLNEAQYQS